MVSNNVVRLLAKPTRAAEYGATKATEMFRSVASSERTVLVQGAQSYRAFRKAFGELAEDEARRAYLDMIDRAITARASDTSGWASLYEAADFMREHEEFWTELGFATFEDYWRDRAGRYFSSLHELEAAYNYAVVACPELFNVDWNEATQQAQAVARIRQVPAAMPHGIKRTHGGHYLTEEDASARVIEGGDWVDRGGESFEYRVSRIKRDRPDVFNQMVAGAFFKKTQTGVVTIDLKAAEAAAGTRKPKVRPQKELSGRARMLASTVKNQLRNNTSQNVFIDGLLNLPWVVNALKARGWKKD